MAWLTVSKEGKIKKDEARRNAHIQVREQILTGVQKSSFCASEARLMVMERTNRFSVESNVLVEEAAGTVKTESLPLWVQVHTLFCTALELCRLSATQECDVEAEILFQKAAIESQMLLAGNPEMLTTFDTFWNAIDLTQRTDQHFGLLRKSYLELARLYLYLITLEAFGKEAMSSTSEEGGSMEKIEIKPEDSKETIPTLSKTYELLAWIAVRAATQVEVAMKTCKVLLEQNITTDTIDPALQQTIPPFASMDLLKTYTDFLSEESKVIHERIVENGKLKEDPNDLTGNDEKQQKYNGPTQGETSFTLSWIHLFRYHNNLRRLISKLNLAALSGTLHGAVLWGNILCTSIFNTGLSLRLAEMHLFLKKSMPSYSACCVDELPKNLWPHFEKPFTSLPPLLAWNDTPSKVNSKSKVLKTSKSVVKLPSTLKSEMKINSHDIMAISSSDNELCFQWYCPMYATSTERGERKISLFYAYNTTSIKITHIKSDNTDNVFCGQLWIPLASAV
ncbi:cilia- and flagella-associated protein 54-like [Ambystoma mexicanum]|uniref:cilia- and flagella-associated protein 54-like n=1 Tax=Ambystoma mexicanum TaxID=8296 RepID=UPI0037E910DE